jgi:hypothetical protein
MQRFHAIFDYGFVVVVAFGGAAVGNFLLHHQEDEEVGKVVRRPSRDPQTLVVVAVEKPSTERKNHFSS